MKQVSRTVPIVVGLKDWGVCITRSQSSWQREELPGLRLAQKVETMEGTAMRISFCSEAAHQTREPQQCNQRSSGYQDKTDLRYYS